MMISILARLRDVASVWNRGRGATLALRSIRPHLGFVRSFALFPALLLTAPPAFAEAPNLDGSWLLEYGGKTVEIAMWSADGYQEDRFSYKAITFSKDANCKTLTGAGYSRFTGPIPAWRKLPPLPRSAVTPDQAHMLTLNIGQNPIAFYRHGVREDVPNSTTHLPSFENNCQISSGNEVRDTYLENQFWLKLYMTGPDSWEGEARVPPANNIAATLKDWVPVRATLKKIALSPTMRDHMLSLSDRDFSVPETSVFAALPSVRTTSQASRQQAEQQMSEARAKAATPAGYLQAILANDRQVIGIADRKFAEPYVKATGSRKTDAYRNLERLVSGRGFATEAQQDAKRSFFENASLLPAVYVTYLFDFERKFPACMQGKRTVEIPWQEITTTTWPSGGQTKRVSASGKVVHSVPGRLFDRLLKVANVEPYAGAASDSILGMMAPDRERISTHAVIRATSAKMSGMKCDSPEQAQFEKNLFALYDAHWEDQERRLNIFYSK